MTRFKSVPVHVSSPVRQTGQARQSAQVKRRGSVLDGPGSKRTRVIRTSVAVDQEESLEEEQWQSPAASEEDWSGSDSEEATSEETRQDGRAENMETPEQTVESIEQEAEFRRDSMSGGRSPELSQAGRAQSSRAPRRSGVEVSPGSVRRRRVKKHVHIAVRKAPATKDNQKGALRAFRVSLLQCASKQVLPGRNLRVLRVVECRIHMSLSDYLKYKYCSSRK